MFCVSQEMMVKKTVVMGPQSSKAHSLPRLAATLSGSPGLGRAVCTGEFVPYLLPSRPHPGRAQSSPLWAHRQVHPHHGPRRSLPFPSRQEGRANVRRSRGVWVTASFSNHPSLLRTSPCLLKHVAKVNWTVFSQKRLTWHKSLVLPGESCGWRSETRARWGVPCPPRRKGGAPSARFLAFGF